MRESFVNTITCSYWKSAFHEIAGFNGTSWIQWSVEMVFLSFPLLYDLVLLSYQSLLAHSDNGILCSALCLLFLVAFVYKFCFFSFHQIFIKFCRFNLTL